MAQPFQHPRFYHAFDHWLIIHTKNIFATNGGYLANVPGCVISFNKSRLFVLLRYMINLFNTYPSSVYDDDLIDT
jgi:hypothetical protein